VDHSQKPKPARRIEQSGAGRIAYRPSQGKGHPLDVQFQEARQAKEQLHAQLALLMGELQALAPLQELPARIEAEDEAVRLFLIERYKDYFHQEHIEATFLWLRRRRATARLQAAQAALSLARELLAPDDFVDQLQDLVRDQPEEKVEMHQERLTGRAKAARDQLARYNTQLQAIRSAITRGNGWIEMFYVHKNGFTPEIIKLAYALYWEHEKGTPIPPELLREVHPEVVECMREHKLIPLKFKEEITTERSYGPYFKYRWREGNSPIYTISLGRLSERPEGTLLPFSSYIRFSRK
jgi:hypothetical protein